ncbi:MAG: hypothetical protein HPY55_10955 [Firmicutes bacterium]|nr:hypothetical protein [Bacillota bacterium]
MPPAAEDHESVERLNQEVRSRGHVVRIFPNEESALQLTPEFDSFEAHVCPTRGTTRTPC